MTTSLKIITLALAALLPGAIAIEFTGLALPTTLEPIHIFIALVTSLVLLTVTNDYQKRRTLRILDERAALAQPQRSAIHPLAA